MQVSARNQLRGRITNVKNGPVSTEVSLDINGQNIVSVITTESATNMGLKVGEEITALIKAGSVILMK